METMTQALPMVIDAEKLGAISGEWTPKALARLVSDVARVAVPHATVAIDALRVVPPGPLDEVALCGCCGEWHTAPACIEPESDAPDFVDGDV